MTLVGKNTQPVANRLVYFLLTWMVELIKAQVLVVHTWLNFKCDTVKYNFNSLTTHYSTHTEKTNGHI